MKRSFKWLSILVLLAMVLGACTPAAATTAPEPTAAPAQTQPTAVPEQPATSEVPPAGQELVDAYAGKFKGTVVTMAGPFTDNDAVVFEASIKPFEDATGIDIQYAGSKEFEANISIQIDGGNPPDIVDFPQPGLLATQVRKGKVIPADSVINPDWLKQNYAQSWLDMATMTDDAGKTIMAGI
ncbi:MAG TPA: hypothetical protein VIO36_06575, partial [Anaerolineaceae bacterium]